MKFKYLFLLTILAAAACSQPPPGSAAGASAGTPAETPLNKVDKNGAMTEIMPGLTGRILEKGYGRAAEAGDLATVHYTGWLHDPNAESNRGRKFDSSVDRGRPFDFPLGEERVIRGWDKGVQGMLIGETRELTIAPEMAYGDRGAGNVIPPGATLVFEVELLRLSGPGDGTSR